MSVSCADHGRRRMRQVAEVPLLPMGAALGALALHPCGMHAVAGAENIRRQQALMRLHQVEILATDDDGDVALEILQRAVTREAA